MNNSTPSWHETFMLMVELLAMQGNVRGYRRSGL